MSSPHRNPVDLTSCNREPIHIPGAIQPHGAMLVVSPDSFDLLYASVNVGGITGYQGLITAGVPLVEIIGEKPAHDVRNAAARAGGGEVAGVELGVTLAHGTASADMIIHRYKDRVFIEIEHSTDAG